MIILKNQNGSVPIITSVIVLGVVTFVSLSSFNAGNKSLRLSAESSKDKDIQIVKEKLIKLSGFLVANSLVVCKEKQWSVGLPAKSCQWNDVIAAGEAPYKARDFNLENKGLNKVNELEFNLDANKVLQTNNSRANHLVGSLSSLKFSLKKASSVGFDMYISSTDLNKDEYLVVVEGDINYQTGGTKNQTERFQAAFRRPIAIPKLIVGTSTCDERCDVSNSENPNKACRSDQYLDSGTTTTVQNETMNLGPGVLYDISYNRTVENKNGSVGGIPSFDSKSAAVPVTNVLVPKATLLWADEISCRTVSKTSQITKYVENQNKPSPKFDGKWIGDLFDNIIGIPSAHAQRTVTVTTSTVVGTSNAIIKSQHSDPVASLTYCVHNCAGGNLEPGRGVAAFYEDTTADVGGMMIDNQTTTYVENRTIIYVIRPH